MTTRHFVTRLKLALDRHEHLDHFHHAGQQLITALQLVDLVIEPRLQCRNGGFKVANLCLDKLLHRIILDSDLLPL